ncbi:hypothetical protein CA13_55210 [Planctomycetes bacterium CA13]|uniref:Uncharacterized protein n=1 Tax=Novipirellula herctigrandis TaxID=2527986 RepID=A0A5C5Z9Z6_9BACT|nr:hypothetical protein CA13_55210 [Planctomycetes bacterium CA13]
MLDGRVRSRSPPVSTRPAVGCSWLQLLARVVRDQTRRGTSNPLIQLLYQGWTSPHDPVMDAVRIRYAELIAHDDAAASPRGPPPNQREAA